MASPVSISGLAEPHQRLRRAATEDLLFVEMNSGIAKGLLAFEPNQEHIKGKVTLAQLLDRIAK